MKILKKLRAASLNSNLLIAQLKFTGSYKKSVHFFFNKPVNSELRLAVLNFL